MRQKRAKPMSEASGRYAVRARNPWLNVEFGNPVVHPFLL